mgnify:CR=1 FL=1
MVDIGIVVTDSQAAIENLKSKINGLENQMSGMMEVLKSLNQQNCLLKEMVGRESYRTELPKSEGGSRHSVIFQKDKDV